MVDTGELIQSHSRIDQGTLDGHRERLHQNLCLVCQHFSFKLQKETDGKPFWESEHTRLRNDESVHQQLDVENCRLVLA